MKTSQSQDHTSSDISFSHFPQIRPRRSWWLSRRLKLCGAPLLFSAAAPQPETVKPGASASRLNYAGVCRPDEDLLDGYFECLTSQAGDVAFVIGEESNGGEPALFVNSLIPHYFSAAIPMDLQEPKQLASDLNDIVCGAREANTSLSCFYAHYFAHSGTLRYFNAGHQAPLLVRSNPHQVVRLNKGGPALGSELTPRYSEGVVPLKTGDRLVAFTQGVVNSWASKDDKTGEAALVGILRDWTGRNAAELANFIVHDAPASPFERQTERTVFVASLEGENTVEGKSTVSSRVVSNQELVAGINGDSLQEAVPNS